MIIKPQFFDATNFAEGLAAVQVDEKWGYVDKTGELIIPPQFEMVWNFSEGLARVKVGRKWGYITNPLQ